MSNSQLAPIPGNVINQILYLETPGNSSRHVDKCCTAGLGNSLNMALFGCLLLYYNTCLASQYRQNKATGLRHTHLHTLNSDHYVYERILDKLQQSYTPPIYPGCEGGGDGVSGSLCLLYLISETVILYLTLLVILMRENSCK